MSSKRKTFYVLDGNSFAYRSFFAIQNLNNSQGMPTNAVYGFARLLQKIVLEDKPDYLAVAFDAKGPTFRHERFKDYKAHRPGMPPELVLQLPLIRELIEAHRIPLLELQGFEADDIMATLALQAKAAGIRSVLLTGDKDMLQFVDEDIAVMSGVKDAVTYDADAVREKFGVGPDRIRDLLALMGDASDNIPGVKGVGPKTAAQLIQEFGGIKELYGRLEKVKSDKLRAQLAGARERVMENHELVLVRTDVPLSMGIADCKTKETDREKLLDLFRRMEFSALMKQWMEKPVLEAAPECKAVYSSVTGEEALKEKLAAVVPDKPLFFDLVTTSPAPMQAEILGAVFDSDATGVFYAQIGADLPLSLFLQRVKPLLHDPTLNKCGHDLKYDAVVLLKHGLHLQGITFDTMLASYLLNPSKLRHGIGDLALEFLNRRMTTVADLLGTGKMARTMREIPVEELARYACEEISVIRQLTAALAPMLQSRQLEKLFRELEIPLELVLAKMEFAGMAVDTELLRELSKELEHQLEEMTQQIYRLAGEEFNIASTKELGHILFEKLCLPTHRKTKTGYSTDVDVLTSLAKNHDLPLLILQYRTLCKLKTTYSDVLPALVHASDGRIHTSFHQTVTATGRLSSSDPNLQNIPVKTQTGLRIRAAFVPGEPGQLLLGADYSQIELRILAHFSGDPNLQEAFRKDTDVHRHTAGLVFGVAPQDVSEEQRRRAKIVNFGILYGMGPFSLAKDMQISTAQAQEFIDNYFKRYTGVRDFMDGVLAKARREKCVTTILGRRRYVPEISSSNFNMRQFAERTAVNTVVQGSAADIIKMAMLALDKELEAGRHKARMLLQIHDELVFEAAKPAIEAFAALVKEKMENVIPLNVPLKVDIKTGKNWADL